jgi:hypothetical protein
LGWETDLVVDNGQQNGGSPATICDFVAGASLGALLGILIGLSTAPVVSIVITGVVALLGAFFGLSDKLGYAQSEGGTRRLIGFALFAALFTLAGIWLRTDELLMPSISSQQQSLQRLGYADGSKEQAELLLFVRYGLLPTGMAVAAEHPPEGGVLYALPTPNVCANLSKAGQASDVIRALKSGDNHLKAVADKIDKLPAERQGDAADVAKSMACSEK